MVSLENDVGQVSIFKHSVWARFNFCYSVKGETAWMEHSDKQGGQTSTDKRAGVSGCGLDSAQS